MESTGEGGERLGLGTVIETAGDGLGRLEIFHILKEILGFVLYMHQQIPSILQHLEHEFDTLNEEYKRLESILTPTEMKACFQRKHNMRKREVKLGIKRLEKLMNDISGILSSLQHALDETHNIQLVTLVLGSSLARPQHVYEIFFPQRRVDSGSVKDCTGNKVAEVLSRKAIRALISGGAGSCSYAGPTKLFLLVKSHCTFNLPLQFQPKRDFRYSKKVVPFRLHIKCKIPDQVVADSHHSSETANSTCLLNSTLNAAIWFQCRHTVKGLASKEAPVMEC